MAKQGSHEAKQDPLTQKLYGVSIHIGGARLATAKDICFVVTVLNKKQATAVIRHNDRPQFNDTFNFVNELRPDMLKLTCKEGSAASGETIAEAQIELSGFFPEMVIETTVTLPGVGAAAAAAAAGEAGAGEAGAGATGAPGSPADVHIDCRIETREISKVVEEIGVAHIGAPTGELTSLFELTIVSARGLTSPHKLHFGKPNPYCRVTYGYQRASSHSVPHTSEPMWDFTTPLWTTKASEGQLVRVSLYDNEPGVDSLLGNCFLRPSMFDMDKKYRNLWLPLTKEDPKTDLELTALQGNLDSLEGLVRQGSAGNTPCGEVRIFATRTPRVQVEEAFYTQLIQHYDIDQSQTLDVDELISLVGVMGSRFTNDEIRAVFREADTQRRGALTMREVLPLLMQHRFQTEDLLKVLHSVMQHGKHAVGRLLLESTSRHTVGDAPELDVNGNTEGQILVADRDTGLLVKESIPFYISACMRLFYRNKVGRLCVHGDRVKKIFKRLTLKEGRKMDAPKSKASIASFIKQYNINTDELEKDVSQYETFNQFFGRALKPGARVCAAPRDGAVAVTPADCRLMVFPTLNDAVDLWIKGEHFSLPALLNKFDKDGSQAAKFMGGSLAVARLAPQDYHRFHYSVDGILQKRYPIDGEFLTVNPIAVRKNVDVYTENKRVICPIESFEFGAVLVIAVGATLVGSINFTCHCVERATLKALKSQKLPNLGMVFTTKDDRFYVSGIELHGPAYIAGIEGADRVLRVNGREVHNEEEYADVVRKLQPGEPVTFEIRKRDGRQESLTLTIEAPKVEVKQCTDGRCLIGRKASRMEQHGWFAFGGSTVLMLFQPGAINFDKDLLKNSHNKVETLVKLGQSLGQSTGKFRVERKKPQVFFEFHCPTCDSTLRVPIARKKFRCPQCQSKYAMKAAGNEQLEIQPIADGEPSTPPAGPPAIGRRSVSQPLPSAATAAGEVGEPAALPAASPALASSVSEQKSSSGGGGGERDKPLRTGSSLSNRLTALKPGQSLKIDVRQLEREHGEVEDGGSAMLPNTPSSAGGGANLAGREHDFDEEDIKASAAGQPLSKHTPSSRRMPGGGVGGVGESGEAQPSPRHLDIPTPTSRHTPRQQSSVPALQQSSSSSSSSSPHSAGLAPSPSSQLQAQSRSRSGSRAVGAAAGVGPLTPVAENPKTTPAGAEAKGMGVGGTVNEVFFSKGGLDSKRTKEHAKNPSAQWDSFLFDCPTCKATLQVPYGKKQFTCPKCRSTYAAMADEEPADNGALAAQSIRDDHAAKAGGLAGAASGKGVKFDAAAAAAEDSEKANGPGSPGKPKTKNGVGSPGKPKKQMTEDAMKASPYYRQKTFVKAGMSSPHRWFLLLAIVQVLIHCMDLAASILLFIDYYQSGYRESAYGMLIIWILIGINQTLWDYLNRGRLRYWFVDLLQLRILIDFYVYFEGWKRHWRQKWADKHFRAAISFQTFIGPVPSLIIQAHVFLERSEQTWVQYMGFVFTSLAAMVALLHHFKYVSVSSLTYLWMSMKAVFNTAIRILLTAILIHEYGPYGWLFVLGSYITGVMLYAYMYYASKKANKDNPLEFPICHTMLGQLVATTLMFVSFPFATNHAIADWWRGYIASDIKINVENVVLIIALWTRWDEDNLLYYYSALFFAVVMLVINFSALFLLTRSVNRRFQLRGLYSDTLIVKMWVNTCKFIKTHKQAKKKVHGALNLARRDEQEEAAAFLDDPQHDDGDREQMEEKDLEKGGAGAGAGAVSVNGPDMDRPDINLDELRAQEDAEEREHKAIMAMLDLEVPLDTAGGETTDGGDEKKGGFDEEKRGSATGSPGKLMPMVSIANMFGTLKRLAGTAKRGSTNVELASPGLASPLQAQHGVEGIKSPAQSPRPGGGATNIKGTLKGTKRGTFKTGKKKGPTLRGTIRKTRSAGGMARNEDDNKQELSSSKSALAGQPTRSGVGGTLRTGRTQREAFNLTHATMKAMKTAQDRNAEPQGDPNLVAVQYMTQGALFQRFYDDIQREPELVFVFYDPGTHFGQPITKSAGGVGALYWCDPGTRVTRADNCLPLAMLEKVLLGKQSEAFTHVVAQGSKSDLCFTLCGTNGVALHLEANQPSHRVNFVSGCQYLYELAP